MSDSAVPLSRLWLRALREGSWVLPRPSGAGRSHVPTQGWPWERLGRAQGRAPELWSLCSPFSVTPSADLGLALPAAGCEVSSWESPCSPSLGEWGMRLGGLGVGPQVAPATEEGEEAAQSRVLLGNCPLSVCIWVTVSFLKCSLLLPCPHMWTYH